MRINERRSILPSVSPIAFKIKYTATIDMKAGNNPRIIARFMKGLRILNLSRDILYATESTNTVEMIHENTEINSVLKNALGKFNSVVSVNSLV